MHLFFCYGTLKKGFDNILYLEGQRYLGIAISEPLYHMFAAGTGFPAVIEAEKVSKPPVSIYGELYEINDECLKHLDRLEDVELELFQRKHIKIKELTLVNLPKTKEVLEVLTKKEAICYFMEEGYFRLEQIVELAQRDCNGFWSSK